MVADITILQIRVLLQMIVINRTLREALQEQYSRLQRWIKFWEEKGIDFSPCQPFLKLSFDMCQLVPQFAKTFQPSVSPKREKKNTLLLSELFPELECSRLVEFIPFELKKITTEEEQKLAEARKSKKQEEDLQRSILEQRDRIALELWEETDSSTQHENALENQTACILFSQ